MEETSPPHTHAKYRDAAYHKHRSSLGTNFEGDMPPDQSPIGEGSSVRVDARNPIAEEDITLTDLAEWKCDFEQEIKPDLLHAALITVMWERKWNLMWALYDQLERKRSRNGWPRADWQNEAEMYRRMGENIKQSRPRTTELNAKDWSQVPLGMLVEKYLGKNLDHDQNGWSVAVAKFQKFYALLREQTGFAESLSSAQGTSAMVLGEWWLGTFKSSVEVEAIKTTLSECISSDFSWGTEDMENPSDPNCLALINQSWYNFRMYVLFALEFHPDKWDFDTKGSCFVTLENARENACSHATAQRLGYTACSSLTGVSLGYKQLYPGSDGLASGWLRRDNKQDEMPYFLWDVQERRTLVVHEMGFKPSYTCVSHTWGRWRNDPTSVDGVPWLVPQNERFAVRTLPRQLQRVRPRLEFVWLDLFCIPQDGSIKANEEINRQAIIFQNACSCIAWLNDVSEWENTRSAIDWLAISYLHASTSTDIYNVEQHLKDTFNDVKNAPELFVKQIDFRKERLPKDEAALFRLIPINSDTLAEPSAWFSSLWTLQEAVLWPNMLLFSRDWKPLVDRSGVPISLDVIMRFISTLDKMWNRPGPDARWKNPFRPRQSQLDWPEGAKQLLLFAQGTRMENLFDIPCPEQVLMVANVRQSTDSRAPAIMSALGFTDWYNPADDKISQKQMVLNCYPFPFVREAATKLGASFYGSVRRQRLEIPHRLNIFDRSTKGSMMPFCPGTGFLTDITGIFTRKSYSPEDHPGVKTWQIRHDGSVRIKSAGIIASTESHTHHSSDALTVDMDWREGQADAEGVRSRPFGEVAKDLPKGMCMFAVSLLKDERMQQGIILRGHKRTMFSSTFRLVKAGFFLTRDTKFPSTTKVDWLVL